MLQAFRADPVYLWPLHCSTVVFLAKKGPHDVQCADGSAYRLRPPSYSSTRGHDLDRCSHILAEYALLILLGARFAA